MRKYALAVLLVLNISTALAQNSKLDSLNQIYKTAKDTMRIGALIQIGSYYVYRKPDTSLLIAQEALKLARSSSYVFGEARSFGVMGNVFMVRGNYPKALELYLVALKKYEEINHMPRVAATLTNIGNLYAAQGYYRQSLMYSLRSFTLSKNLEDPRMYTVANVNAGDAYEKLDMLDSALYHTNIANHLCMQHKYGDLGATTHINLGNIYAKMKKPGLAMEYYRASLPYLIENEDDDGQIEAMLGMAKLYWDAGQNDSCLYYARVSLVKAKGRGLQPRELQAGNFLADYFKSNRNVDSAYQYQSIALTARDSMFSQEKTSQFQSLAFDETMRQQERAAEQAVVEEERRINIQYGIMAIGVISFIVIFILLSNSIIINEKWVRFLGILGLLLVFEFINLIFHSYIAELTHHSPVLMLLIMVAIASVLIPVHHRLEHRLSTRIIAKNKRIRLAAAKKTVAELEKDVEDNG